MTTRRSHIYAETMDLYYRWRRARKYGTLRLEIEQAWSSFWERFWTCRVRGKHQEKMGSLGCCYRCGKAMR